MLQKTPVSVQKADCAHIVGRIGKCGDRDVFIGFAPANLLHAHSFADVLDEETGTGYQRNFNRRHSREFRQYIQLPGSTTIPLTFNLRSNSKSWRIHSQPGDLSVLTMTGKALTQVDCQHRIGSLNDISLEMVFMAYIGLNRDEEAEIFTVINSKAKGLSTSLIDYNTARLSDDLSNQEPHLYVALNLNSHESSPWLKQLDLGGKSVVGMKRRASLRTMQVAVTKFLKGSNILATNTPSEAAAVVLDFWIAVSRVLATEWRNPRKYFIVKGIGVYSLMMLAADLYLDAVSKGLSPDVMYFTSSLSEFARKIDWSNHGALKGFSGESGAAMAYQLLQDTRAKVSKVI